MKRALDTSDYIIGIDSIYKQGNKIFKEVCLNTKSYRMLFEDMVDLTKIDINNARIRSRLIIGDYNKLEPVVAFEAERGCIIKGNDIYPETNIDINNIAEKVSSTINNKNTLGSVSSVIKDKKFNIKLKGGKEFDLIPEENGKVILIDDTAYLYRDSEVCLKAKIVFPPESLLDKVMSKYIYLDTNDCMVVKDYSIPQVFSYSYKLNDVNLKVNYQSKHDIVAVGNYNFYYPRDLVTDVEIYEDGHRHKYSLSYDFINANHQNILDEYMLYDTDFAKSGRAIAYNESTFKDTKGKLTHIYNTIYPISYTNILGFIFMDDTKYRIYCNDIHRFTDNKLIERSSIYYKVPIDKEEEFFKVMNEGEY